MDFLTPAERSLRMSLVRSKHTRPELIVRKIAYQLGYRYRLHVTSLPGRPDIVFRRAKKVIFVNGCFWHSHTCSRATKPRTRAAWWQRKLSATAGRDRRNQDELRAAGWEVLVLWECELSDRGKLLEKLRNFLDTSASR